MIYPSAIGEIESWRSLKAPKTYSNWWITTTKDLDQWREDHPSYQHYLGLSAETEKLARDITQHFCHMGMGEDQKIDDLGKYIVLYYEPL